MERNLILASVLSVLFLIGWYHFVSPPAPARVQSARENMVKEAKIESPQRIEQPAKISAPVERVLDTPFARIVIDSRGAAVKHWVVKENEKISSNGQDQADLVNHPSKVQLLPYEKYPLSTYPELAFTPVSSPLSRTESVWRATMPSGVQIEKKFLFSGGNFIRFVVTLKNGGKDRKSVEEFKIGWREGLGTVESERKENEQVTRVLAYPSPQKEVVVFKKPKEERVGSYHWMGVDNRYYLFAFLPHGETLPDLLAAKNKSNPGQISLAADQIDLAGGERKVFEFDLYGGPKEYTFLKQWGLGLEHSVDFGTFGFLGKWALKAMDGIYKGIGNYGWTIILLTCALQVLLFPLSLKSYQSMAAMKRIQPKMQELQKRYKEDPKRLNQEMLSLYKEAKTNPFGGCLPMILQIPVFWAFFTMLRNSYELRGTPWIFWIKDLSQHDPYYVLPIVMGGGMFLQQKLSGTSGDPAQAKMMAFMPIIFTVMFLKFPSGLVLYWLTNSILSIGIQYWCTKKFASAPH